MDDNYNINLVTAEDKRDTQIEDTLKNLAEHVENLKIEVDGLDNIFNFAPVPMLVADLTFFLRYAKKRLAGYRDLKQLVLKYPEEFENCLRHIEITKLNQASLNLHAAKSKDDFVNKYFRIFTEDNKEEFIDLLSGFVRGKTNFKFEVELKSFNNKNLILELYAKVTRMESYNEVKHFVLLSTIDITERKKTELKLKESEQNIKALLNNSSDIILLLDIEGSILEVNEHQLYLMNASRKDIINTSIFNFLDSNLTAISIERFDKIKKTKSPLSFTDNYADRIWETKLFPILNENEIVSKIALFSKDVTAKAK